MPPARPPTPPSTAHAPGGPLTVSRCTVIGAVRTTGLVLAENSLFLHPVTSRRRQEGCVRFCHVPPGSRTPRRYHCQPPAESPELAARLRPRFTSLRYGDPGYCQLTPETPPEIRRGAEDESEMGVFSSLRQPQREDGLRIRLEEYLRVGLEARDLLRDLKRGATMKGDFTRSTWTPRSATAASASSRGACSSTPTGTSRSTSMPTCARPSLRTT